jgi:hypothetical protein
MTNHSNDQAPDDLGRLRADNDALRVELSIARELLGGRGRPPRLRFWRRAVDLVSPESAAGRANWALAGAALLCYGLALIYRPFGFIAGGALLIAGAVLAARAS